MIFNLPGFPTEISEELEIPDISQLLFEPWLISADYDYVMKNGTSFQKYLIDKTPLKHTTKYANFNFIVNIEFPGMRNLVESDKNSDGWHIDGSSNEFDYLEGTEVVHLLQSSCSSLTEFNKNKLTIKIPNDLKRNQLISHLREYHSFNIESQKVPPNKIVTFSNHIHRPIDPPRIEFRFVYRAMESNEHSPVKGDSCVVKDRKHWDPFEQKRFSHMQKNDNSLTILPNRMYDNFK